MKKIIIKKLCLTIAVCFSMIFGLVKASANVNATKRAFGLSPMSQSIVLIPGETYEGSIKIINPSDADTDFNYVATVGSYSVAGDENSIDDYAVTNETDITNFNQIVNWVKIKNDTGVIAPGESAVLSFRIDVPKDAPGGGQYATILVKDDITKRGDVNVEGENGMGVSEVTQMGSVIYAEVMGDIIKKGEISDNSIPAFLLNGQLETASMVKNDGNIHTDAEYILQVWPVFSDEEICTNEENPSKSLVLPETKRYHAESCNLTAPGVYKVKQIVRIFGEESVAEKIIIYCPIWLMFLIIFVIAALIIWIIMRIKSRNKKSNKTPSKEDE